MQIHTPTQDVPSDLTVQWLELVLDKLFHTQSLHVTFDTSLSPLLLFNSLKLMEEQKDELTYMSHFQSATH